MAVDGTEAADKKPLPPGVVLGKDGKPCRTCSSGAAFAAFASKAKASPSPSPSSPSSQQKASGAVPGALASTAAAAAAASASSAASAPPKDCPPDVEELGRSTWTLLHSMAATYPAQASAREQTDLRSFLSLFSRLYPCWVCAEDFQRYLQTEQVRVGGRAEFGQWLCEAHNAVNLKLGKKAFDCARWEERWRDGWKDGRCD